MKILVAGCVLLAVSLVFVQPHSPAVQVPGADPTVATFSVAGYDPQTGDLGVAVQSKFFGVGSIVPWAKAGVGAIATQAYANTTYGPKGLALLELGLSPEEVVNALTGADLGRDFRQVGMVDARGRSAAFTGKKAQEWRGHVTGANYTCQGNILASEDVVKRMSHAFRFTEGPLAERLIAVLKAGQSAGGDKRGKQSAALLVVRNDGGYAGWNDHYIDIRVEDHAEPIKELERLLKMHRRFFGKVPVPGKEKGELALEGKGSPGAVFNAWKAGILAGEYEKVYELYSKDYRAKTTKEEFVASGKGAHKANVRALEVLSYVKAVIKDDTATVYYRHLAANRPRTMAMVKEGGEWRIKR